MQGRFAAALAAVGTLVAAVPASASTFGEARERLRDDARGELVVRDRGDRAASFVVADVSAERLGVAPGASPEAVAEAALERYDGLVAGAELRAVATEVDPLGGRHVRFEQLRGGVPVLHGEATVHLDREGDDLRAISASVAADASPIAGAPQVGVAAAIAAARTRLPGGEPEEPARLVAYAGELADAARSRLAWAVDLLAPDGAERALVVVDATDGTVLAVHDRTHDALQRRTYSAYNRFRIPGWLVLLDDQGSTRDADVNAAHGFAAQTYDYYLRTFGRDSWDGSGGTVRSTANYGREYRNAFWNGRQVVYGDGFATSDVVAHELTHAVTEAEGGLVYQGESGALNEALSDMAAWDVDPDDTTIGEDLPIGAIRDVADPNRLGQPATTAQYVCTSQDNGGVHANSGILNRVYVNLVGQVGRGAAQWVRYLAQTSYLEPTASFSDARAAFVQAAEDLAYPTDRVLAAFDAQGVAEGWAPDCAV